MLRVFFEDTFDSAHSLPNLPDSHKCHHLHGHTYMVRMEFSGLLGADSGWIVDYGVLKSCWGTVKQHLDHKFLNEIITPSTCENLAVLIRNRMKDKMQYLVPLSVKLTRIELRETEHCGVVLE